MKIKVILFFNENIKTTNPIKQLKISYIREDLKCFIRDTINVKE